MATCKATRTDGSRCQAQLVRESDFCFWHNPASRRQMIEASRRGGLRRIADLPEADLLTPARARAILAAVVQAVAGGALGNSTARTIGYLLLTEARIREGHELQKRVESLEEAVANAEALEKQMA